MPRASESPFTLDIVRCSKSWTTVDVGRCSQCCPTNGSPGRRRIDVPGRRRIQERSSGKKMDEQSWIAPQKSNRRSPRAGFSDGRGFRRHLLSRYFVRAEVRDGESQRAAEMWSLGSEERGKKTDGGLSVLCLRSGGREQAEEFRSRRHGETVTGAINSPPPSRRETPIIM